VNNAARHAPYAHKTTKLVRHSHEEEPDELMLLATERYCHAEHFDRLTMRQYCEAFEILAPQIKRTTTQVVARSLASCPFAPRAVVMALALEPVNVARPILLQSQVLGQLDMLRIIDVAGKRHAMTLAERHDIGPSVVKRLRELKAEEIDTALDENPAIAEARETQKLTESPAKIDPAMQPAAIVRKVEVESNGNIETPGDLIARAKMEIEESEGVLSAFEFERQVVSGLEAFPDAEAGTDFLRSGTQKAHFGENESEDGVVLQAGNEVAASQAVARELADSENELLLAAGRGGRLAGHEHAESTPGAASVSGEAVPNLGNSLELIAAAKSSQGMATLLAKASGFSLDTAFQVLEDTSGDTLAVFLKSHEIEPAAASRILMLTFPSIGLSTQNALRAVRFYKTLETESCREAVGQWPKDEAPRAAHQPYLEESDGVRWSVRDSADGRRDIELEEARRQALS